MKKVKIGFLPLNVKLYDDGAPNMRLRIDAFAKEVIGLFKTCAWFEPNKYIANFLQDYSKLGGTHNLCLMYGDARKAAETFAKVIGYEYYEI